MKINLLYVITKLELGGAQKHLLGLIENLDRKKYNVFLISARDGILIDRVILIRDLHFMKSVFLERSINPLKDLLALCQIYVFIKHHKINIVHTHSSKAGILGRWAAFFAGVKIVIHTVHGWSFNDYQNMFWRRVNTWLEKITGLITDKIIVVSQYDLSIGMKNRIGQEQKYTIIRYGVKYNEFSDKREGLRKELKIADDDLLIGMVACFKPQKSPEDFISLAFLIKKLLSQTDSVGNRNNFKREELPYVKVKFILVGDGVLRRKIEGLISKLNLNKEVILTGWRHDIPRVFSAIDLFILTSLWEGMPISVLEAMASSLPVIVSNTGGVAEVVKDGQTGFIVKKRDIISMAEKAVILLKDEKLRKQIGRSAKFSLGTDYSFDSMISNIEDVYNSLLKSKVEYN